MLVGLLKFLIIALIGCWITSACCQPTSTISNENLQQEIKPKKIARQDIFQSIYAMPQFRAPEKKSKAVAMIDKLKGLKELARVQLQPNMELELSTIKAGPLSVQKSNIIPIHENLQAHEGRFGSDRGYGIAFNYDF